MTFKNGKEMLAEIQANTDLYNPVTEQYVFCYNAAGSIAVYNISNKEASKLKEMSEAAGEYWGAFLGPGGYIYDDPNEEGDISNLDWCNNNYEGEWENEDIQII